ncbi:MAG TPA: D-hexose-6-phosphate mutarotase [Candidatus Acidoferrum sp.]|nr:D-hexose-6-phosphate mutarotase [Candidatus Acidoferrum sp.]
MADSVIPDALRKFEIPGRVTFAGGKGGLPKINVTTPRSTAEIYLHGAHVTHFQKTGEPPLLFLSARSRFAPGQPIRGGVPICFPWFGSRADAGVHGFARITEWKVEAAAALAEEGVTLRFHLPRTDAGAAWPPCDTELAVTITDRLTMELITTNRSPDRRLEFENCLHTYFAVGDIDAVSLSGLEAKPFDDFARGANGVRRNGDPSPLLVTQETNRVYFDHAGMVEIRDDALRRVISVQKFNSRSTVVWNPWTTQKLPDDFDPAEHRRMVCVESGNVKQDKLALPPGQTTTLKVVLSSRPL